MAFAIIALTCIALADGYALHYSAECVCVFFLFRVFLLFHRKITKPVYICTRMPLSDVSAHWKMKQKRIKFKKMIN